MFAQRISNTAFTDREVASVSKIQGENIYDAVFMSVLRAVLPQHIGDDEVHVRFRSTDMSSEACDRNGSDWTLNRLYDPMIAYEKTICVIDLRYQNVIHKYVSEGFEERFEGWKRIERVSNFFSRSFNVLCFVNEAKKSTILVVGRCDVPRIHYLLCSLFAWLPWYFNKETGVSADEMALMQSLRKSSPDEFLSVLKRFEEKQDLYSLRLQALAGFENQWMSTERADAVDSIERVMAEIERFRNSIADSLRRKEELEIRVMGLDAAMAKNGTDSEIRDYFLANKNRLWLVERDNDVMTFEVMTQFAYWDPEYAETLYKNKNSILYTSRGGTPRIRSNEMGDLFKAIFLDQTLKLHVCAAYTIEVRGCRVRGVSGYEYGPECSKCFPNPHIHVHHCLGGYAQALSQMIEHHDYVGAMEQCVVSCQSINLTETPTMEPFIRSFYACNSSVIELPDGKMVTPVEAVEYLKSQGKCEEDESNEQAD